jgi:CRP-like cAMP-binding protein
MDAAEGAAPLPSNRLLAAVPTRERLPLLAQCEHVDLASGEMLYERGDRLEYVYFPTSSFVALIASADQRSTVGAGLIGVEGMLGLTFALGVEAAPLSALVIGAGSAYRLPAGQFSRALAKSRVLDSMVRRYLYIKISQLAQTAACNYFHRLEARLARWLLMTRACAHADRFHLTQETIAELLGVRREGVTGAALDLQARKLIRYARGNITIIDARGLRAVSCPCCTDMEL